MKFYKVALTGFAAFVVISANALAIDIELDVKAQSTTSMTEVSYRLSGVTETTSGANATTPVTLSLTGLSAGAHTLVTSFGNFAFELDAAGNITVDPGVAMTVSDSTLTIQNTIDFPTLAVEAVNPTSLVEISYDFRSWDNTELPADERIDVIKTISGSAAQAGVSFPFTGMAPNQQFILITSFGNSIFRLDALGNMVDVGGATRLPFDALGSTLTIRNTIDFPTLAVEAVNPTSLVEISYDFRSWDNTQLPADERIDVIKTISGSAAQAGVSFPFTGMAPNQQFILITSFGNSIFRLDALGNMVDVGGATRLPFDALGSTLTIRNTIDFPTLAVEAVNPTSLVEISYDFRSWDNTQLPADERIDVIKTISGSAAQAGVSFPFTGMAPNQQFILITSFGNSIFRLDALGNMVDVGGATRLPFDALGSTLTIRNTIDFPTLAVEAVNPTSLVEISYDFRSWDNTQLPADERIDVIKTISGSAAQAGVSFPFTGMAPNQQFILITSFGNSIFRLDASGNMVDVGGANNLPFVAVGSTLTIQNIIDFALEVTTEQNSGESTVSYSLYSTWNTALPANRLVDTEKTLPGSETQEGVDIAMAGMAPNQSFVLLNSLGSNPNFQLLANGTATFFAPTAQLTPTKGSLPIESGTNTLFLELLSPNTPPVVDAGEDLAIFSTEQSATVIVGSGTDAEGDKLTCRWLEGTTVLFGPTVLTGSICELDLGTLEFFSLGDHTLTLEISDGTFTVTDTVVVTVMDNCPVSANYRGAEGFLVVRGQLQALIDDPGTPLDVADDLEAKVLKKVNEAFEEFLKGHPHHMGADLKSAIKKLQDITDDYGYDTSTQQAEVATLSVVELCGLIDRVELVTGPSDDDLIEAEAGLSEALTALAVGDYELTAEHARKGSEEIKAPDYVGNFCPGSPLDAYSVRLCEIQAIRDTVVALFDSNPQDDKLKNARDKLRDGLRKLAVLNVKESAKKFREALEKLTEVTAVDVTPQIEALTGTGLVFDPVSGVAALLKQYLADAEASGHDPMDLMEAQNIYGLGELAREEAQVLYGQGDFAEGNVVSIVAMKYFEQAAAKAKP